MRQRWNRLFRPGIEDNSCGDCGGGEQQVYGGVARSLVGMAGQIGTKRMRLPKRWRMVKCSRWVENPVFSQLLSDC